MKKVLLTTIHRPLNVENETCTKNISSEVYHPQITSNQGPFSIRVHCTGWGLEFIGSNLETPTTVLHYPTKRTFIKELKKGYDYVGISFVICTFPKALELCKLVRTYSPQSKIVLGGYGTVLKECDSFADYVCREEGVNFFKRLLGEEPIDRFQIPVFKRSVKIMSVSTQEEAIIPAGLGCSRGCDFCCTSHFFDRRHYSLIKTGQEIYERIASINFRQNASRNIGIVDEDFLADRKKIMSMAQFNAREIKKPLSLSCLCSLKSLSQYSIQELVSMGLSSVWVGIESKRANYPKLKNINSAEMISQLKNAGINVLISIIIGYDWHDEKTIEEDFQYLLSLQPVISQIMLYSPCPQTPLYNKLKKENRLLDVPYIFHDGFHALFKHPYLSTERLESLLRQLLEREYEELGPSIFRILEVQLRGYQSFRDNPLPLFKTRANEHRKLCLKIYPLLKTGTQQAPSLKVKRYLEELREEIEAQFQIKASEKIKAFIAPLLYFYTQCHDKFHFHPQPRTEITRYHANNRTN
jgi:radical SAM superfamily enzyme YgiQ (UPF0313 family)